MTKNVGHKLCVWTSHRQLSDDSHTEKIKCVELLDPTEKQCLWLLERK